MKLFIFVVSVLVIISFSVFVYGVSAVIDILPQLNSLTEYKTGIGTEIIRNSILEWMPQNISEYWIPLLVKISQWMMSFAPLLFSILEYAIFFFWISGVLLIMATMYFVFCILQVLINTDANR